MERVYGRDLLRHLRKLEARGDRFTISEAIDVLIRIAEIVATVHHAGIAHCDLKPDNILLAANRRVVLLDFGVFQPERRLADRPRLFATPYYAAPEIVVNEVEPGRGYLVDIYAFGVIAYEILTGHPPLRGETSTQTLMKHVSEPPPLVSDERADAPPWLAQLIRSTMAKEPLERPESMDNIISQLRAARPVRAVSSRPPRTVLIVDDDDDFRALVEQCVQLALPDAEIRTAVDGDDALAQFRAQPPALLLTDLQMPGLSGVELCMYVRGTRLAERTRIIAMSAHADDGDRDLLHQLGIEHVIGKHGHGARSFTDALSAVLTAGYG